MALPLSFTPSNPFSGQKSSATGIAYGKDGSGVALWVAVGANTFTQYQSQNVTIVYSHDGITWTPSNGNPFMGNGGSAVAFGKSNGRNIWVAVGRDAISSNYIGISYNGIDWTDTVSAGGNNPFNTGFASSPGSIAWDGTTWFIYSYETVVTSTDGINWSYIARSTLIDGKALGTASNNSVWVVVGNGIATAPKNYPGDLTSVSLYPVNAVAWNGSIWLAVGNTILRSILADASVWTSTKPFFTTTAKGIAWNGSYWVMVGYFNDGRNISNIATSFDGINWTLSSTPFSSQATATNVAWGSAWVVVAVDEFTNTYTVAISNTATAPTAPTLSSTVTNGSATLTWNQSTSGLPVTYTVTATPGNLTQTTTANTVTFIGLTSSPYTFTVVATNSLGTAQSTTSVTGLAYPPTVTIITAIPGDFSATINWSATSNGSPVTGYIVTRSPGNFSQTTTNTTATFTGLTNGTAYTFTVVATSAAGNSAPSTSVVTPQAPPTIVAVTAANGSALVTYTSNSGLPVTYTVTASPGNFTQTTRNTTATFTGLTNGTTYTFTVVATNSLGSSSSTIYFLLTDPVITGPLIITVTLGTIEKSSVTLNWNPSPSGLPTTYRVTNTRTLETKTTIGNTMSFTGLQPIITTFTIDATNSLGTSQSTISIQPLGIPVPIMGGIYIPDQRDSSLVLTWNALGTGITGYTVKYEKLRHANDIGDRIITTINIPAPLVILRGLTNGVEYVISIYATNAFGNSDIKNIIVDTRAFFYRPATYISLSATCSSYGVPNSLLALHNQKYYDFIGREYTGAYNLGEFRMKIINSPSPVISNLKYSFSNNLFDNNFIVTLTWDLYTIFTVTYIIVLKNQYGEEVYRTSYNFLRDYSNLNTFFNESKIIDSSYLNFNSLYTFYIYAKVISTDFVGRIAPELNVSFTTPHAFPETPINLSSSYTLNSITLNWSSPNSKYTEIIGYKIIDQNNTYTDVGFVYSYTFAVTPENTYTYSVQSYNFVGSGNFAYYPSITTGTTPSAPSGLSVNLSILSITLSWTAPYDGGVKIDKYFLYNQGALYAEIPGSSLTTTITGIPATTYTFSIAAYNSLGTGPSTRFSSITTDNIIPYGPSYMNGSISSNTIIELSWGGQIPSGWGDTQLYILYGTTLPTSGIKTFSQSYTVNNLTRGTYTFTVYAYNLNGKSINSASNTFTINSRPSPITRFGLESEQATWSTTVHLTWSYPDDDGGTPVTYYTIHKNYTDVYGSIFNTATRITSNLEFFDTTHRDSGDVRFFYSITAHNDVGDSDPYNTRSFL